MTGSHPGLDVAVSALDDATLADLGLAPLVLQSSALSTDLHATNTKSVNLDGPPGAETSAALLTEVRDRLDDISGVVNRELLVVADTLVRARAAYELETATGKGKRNPDGVATFVDVAAEELARSPSFVERLLRLAQLDDQTRALVSEIPKLMSNQDALLALAREPELRRRHLAVAAFQDGGRSAFNRVLNAILVPADENAELDEGTTETALEFLDNYQVAKRAAAEERQREIDAHEESAAAKKRRANSKAVFEYLAGGETKLGDAALERIGVTRAECTRAVDDLRYSGMIQSTSYLDDTFEVLDGRDMTHFEARPARKPFAFLTIPPGRPIAQKLKGGMYEIAVRVLDGAVEVTLRGV